MEIKKNDVCTVVITDISSEGEGIGKLDGYTVFVKDTVVGDEAEIKIIKAKKNYGYGRLMRLIKASDKRAEPLCPIARQCGGCQLQAYAYEEQLIFKQNKIKNNLDRIGKITDYTMHPIIGMERPYYYRNKAQFPVGLNKEGRVITGFYAGRTHSIMEQDDCVLGLNVWDMHRGMSEDLERDSGEEEKKLSVNQSVLQIVRTFMEENDILPYQEETHQGLVRHVLIRQGYHTGGIMVCLVINGKKLENAEKLVGELCKLKGMASISLSVNMERTNVILGKKLVLLWGTEYITDKIGGVSFQISPLSFFQVNLVQTEKLYAKVLEYAGLSGDEIVWDLYCGIGTISLFLAKNAKKVYGVEIVPQAIENAKENARRNGIRNAEFFVGKAEEVLPEWYKEYQEKADVVVVDPPRKGCDEKLLETIVKMEPEKIIYVSCDSATLARDLAVLREEGYEVRDVQGVDMFPQTVHVEVVILMTRCGF